MRTLGIVRQQAPSYEPRADDSPTLLGDCSLVANSWQLEANPLTTVTCWQVIVSVASQLLWLPVHSCCAATRKRSTPLHKSWTSWRSASSIRASRLFP